MHMTLNEQDQRLLISSSEILVSLVQFSSTIYCFFFSLVFGLFPPPSPDTA